MRRVAAAGALATGALAAVAAIFAVRGDVGRAVLAPLIVLGVVAAAWSAVTRRGRARLGFGVLAGAGAVAFAVMVLTAEAHGLGLVIVFIMTAATVALARVALRPSTGDRSRATTAVPAAAHGVLLMNPRSGGGKAVRFRLEDEARRRGVEPVVLRPGDDLLRLARDAVDGGADALGMAGGDGSQALVASVAMEAGIPFVCVPAGTRNHFALDLGLDREDVVGALDAFAEAYERRVDLAEVGERVFVNNVSLGVYAKIVQSPEYRDAKRQTTSELLPELLGPDAGEFPLRFTGPDGREHAGAPLVLVSNNPYVLTALGGLGSRARLDTGRLGITALEVRSATDVALLAAAESAGRPERFRGWHAWSAPTFVVESGRPVEAGVDGEALVLEPPLRFRSLPGALRVRLPLHAPGRSPAAQRSRSVRWSVLALLRVVAGDDPRRMPGGRNGAADR